MKPRQRWPAPLTPSTSWMCHTAHRMPVNAASVRGLVSDIVPPPHPIQRKTSDTLTIAKFDPGAQSPSSILAHNRQVRSWRTIAKFDPGAQSPSSILVHLGCSHTGIPIAKFDPGAPGLPLAHVSHCTQNACQCSFCAHRLKRYRQVYGTVPSSQLLCDYDTSGTVKYTLQYPVPRYSTQFHVTVPSSRTTATTLRL